VSKQWREWKTNAQCTVCGEPRTFNSAEFDQHQRTQRHIDAVQRWDEDHGPIGRQQMSRHDFHVWLRIGCGRLDETAAA
jgi:hypothetical protein